MSSEKSMKDLIVGRVSAVLMTLAEVEGPAPASSIYLGLQMDLEMYRRLIELMKVSGLIVATPETISLTARGRSVAAELNRVIGQIKTGSGPAALETALSAGA